MQHNEIYMSLEISMFSIKAMVAEYYNGKTHVLASCEKRVPHTIKEEDTSEMKNIIDQVRIEIASLLGYEIKNTILIIPSNNCKKFSDKVRVDALAYNQVITKDEISKGIEEIIKKNDNEEEFVANVTIDKYSAFGYGYVSNPVGLETRYIELEASVYTIPTDIAYPLITMVEEVGFNVVDVCLDIIAIANESVVSSALKNGAVLVDMNYSSTNIAYFKNNTLKSYATIDLGGQHITNDLSLCAQIDFEKAESFKKKYVNLVLEEIDDLVIYRYYDEVNDEEVEITQKFISQVALSRVNEIVSLVAKELVNLDIDDGEVIYFCGGANSINGLNSVLKEKMHYPFMICHPQTLGARNSSMIKCLGAIKHEAELSRVRGEIKLFVNKKAYIDSINLVEKNNLLYNDSSKSESDFVKRLVSYIFNN